MGWAASMRRTSRIHNERAGSQSVCGGHGLPWPHCPLPRACFFTGGVEGCPIHLPWMLDPSAVQSWCSEMSQIELLSGQDFPRDVLSPWPCVSLVPTSLDLTLQTALSSPRLPQRLSGMFYLCLPSPLPLLGSPSGPTDRSSVSALWASLPVPSLHPTQYRINPEGAKCAPPTSRRPNWLWFYYFLGFSKLIFKAFLFYPCSAIFLTTENLNGHWRSSPLRLMALCPCHSGHATLS